MEREGKVSAEEIAKLWNNLAKKAMDGIREVEELDRLEKELGIEESEDEENGEEEAEVISSGEEEEEPQVIEENKEEPKETNRSGELQWGQWLKKARLKMLRVIGTKEEEVEVLRLRGGGENDEYKYGIDPQWKECVHCKHAQMLWATNECEEGRTRSLETKEKEEVEALRLRRWRKR